MCQIISDQRIGTPTPIGNMSYNLMAFIVLPLKRELFHHFYISHSIYAIVI